MTSDKWANTASDLASIFDTLNIEVVLKRSLNYLSTKIACNNVYWIASEVFKENKMQSLTPASNNNVFYGSQVNEKINELMPLLDDFGLNTVFFEHNEEDVQISVVNERMVNFIVPVFVRGKGHNIGYFVFDSVERSTGKNRMCELVRDIVKQMSQHIQFSFEHFKLKGQTLIDDVTELYNQRYLKEVLEKEIDKSRKDKVPFTVLFLDVDNFKLVNDTLGHVVGSKVLSKVGDILKKQIGSQDYAFRYGGDEFILLLVDADSNKAGRVAEQIREKIETNSFNMDGSEFKITVSIGLASFPTHAKSSEQVIRLADQAMYSAKNKSRNIVYVTAS